MWKNKYIFLVPVTGPKKVVYGSQIFIELNMI